MCAYQSICSNKSLHTIFNRIVLQLKNGKYGSRSAGCCSESIFASNGSSDWKFVVVVVVKKLCNFLYLLTIHVTSDLEHFFF